MSNVAHSWLRILEVPPLQWPGVSAILQVRGLIDVQGAWQPPCTSRDDEPAQNTNDVIHVKVYNYLSYSIVLVLYMLFVILLSYFYALLLLLTDSKTVDAMKHLLASVESVLARGGHQFGRRLLGNTCLCIYESF